jgi:hypothetical protein
VLIAQAEEVRTLSLKASTDVAEPMRRHAAQQAEQVQALSNKVTTDAAKAVKRQVTKFEDELRKAG